MNKDEVARVAAGLSEDECEAILARPIGRGDVEMSLRDLGLITYLANGSKHSPGQLTTKGLKVSNYLKSIRQQLIKESSDG